MASPVEQISMNKWIQLLDRFPQDIFGMTPKVESVAMVVVAYTLIEIKKLLERKSL